MRWFTELDLLNKVQVISQGLRTLFKQQARGARSLGCNKHITVQMYNYITIQQARVAVVRRTTRIYKGQDRFFA